MPHLFDPSKIVDGKSHTKRHLEKVRTWVTKRMPQTGKAPKVSCKEVLCGDPTCAPVDTVIDLLFDDQTRMVALPFEAQDVTEEILDHCFPPADVLKAWMNGEDAAWPPPPNDELRFDVGSRVECCVGADHWEPGTVVALWYTEEGFPPGFYAPYQVELDMGNLIFAPDDSDRCVRELISLEGLNVSDGA
jgi:hypothetical protein